MNKVKYLIVGGGVSGLAFANFVDSEDYLIIEKEAELGGFCRTIYQDGFVWDYAGHFFHFATKELKDFFQDKISSEQLVERDKVTKVYFDDQFVDFPFQANIHQLKKERLLNCLYDLYFREEKDEYSSFLDMLYSKFGKSITEYFLKPYNEKLYACDLDTLDVDAMGRFFPYANLDQVIGSFKAQSVASYNAHFLYPKKGAKVFVDALAEDIKEDRILLNEPIVSIDAISKKVVTDKRTIEFDYLINSAPLNRFLPMFSSHDFTSEQKSLSYNKVLVLNLGFDKKSPYEDLHWLYFPQKDINFYRVGFYDNILKSDKLSMYVEVGYAPEDSVDIEKQLSQTLEGLRCTGIITDHKLESYCTLVMDPAYVHVSQSSNNTKSKVFTELSKHNIYSIGRYGDWKYCSIEDSMQDAVKLAKEIS
ncbi:FAD-dependent oxidoreductase [Vibrio sp. D404a]|uniref:protoporphyrinogen/coproporphyrinogen oxidase n=1 Tax=unclassified Vibrio TaxID=2614977 RepID=UPI002554F3F2|nr:MULTISPECIES: FAD-dependent oxidoreductase [unclassified Vibrio]MDK9737701.1 FAD-dependent oxidoreductase [Vibrio sp. D404a]MDK9795303.1 FAD-dependent oxidoreductase [Vibrio sp. D449a]